MLSASDLTALVKEFTSYPVDVATTLEHQVVGKSFFLFFQA